MVDSKENYKFDLGVKGLRVIKHRGKQFFVRFSLFPLLNSVFKNKKKHFVVFLLMDCLYFPHFQILVYNTVLNPLIPKSDWLPISPYCTFLIQFFEFTCNLKCR